MDIDDALRDAERWLDEIDGVEGVARGKTEGDDCITVFVSSRSTAGEIPQSLHGYRWWWRRPARSTPEADPEGGRAVSAPSAPGGRPA